MGDPQQLEDAQMLLALGLPTLAGRDHEQAGVDTTYPREHVADESLVAGDVDERNGSSGRELHGRKAEIDG